jgi:methanogenic corrinoid protein MtbC1
MSGAKHDAASAIGSLESIGLAVGRHGTEQSMGAAQMSAVAIPRMRCEGADQRLARLVQTIESEIIPRLVLARRADGTTIDSGPDGMDGAIGAEAVAEFSQLVVDHDVVFANAYVETLRTQGVGLDRIFLELLAPAARHLGEQWHDDRLDFTEVTVGLCRLHTVLQQLSPAFADDVGGRDRGRRVLLATAAGEQHTFGILMVAEFFRRAGWDVRCAPPSSADELLAMVHRTWFAVVGLSVSCASRVDGVAALIRSMRKASINPELGVLVGGQIFTDHPEYVARVGADATANDAQQAPVQAERLLDLLAKPC